MADTKKNIKVNIIPGDDSGIKRLRAFNEELNNQRQTVDKTTADFNELRASQLGALDAVEKYNKEASKTPSVKTGKEPNFDVGQASGKVSTALSSFSSLVGGSPIAQTLSDITDFAEKIPQVGKVLGDASGAAGGAVPVLGGVSVGLGTIAAVAAPIIAIAGAAAFAISTYNKAVEEGKKAAEFTGKSIQETSARQYEINELIKKGDKDALESKRAAAFQELAIGQSAIDGLTKQRDAVQKEFDNTDWRLFEDRGNLQGQIDEFNKQIGELQPGLILAGSAYDDYVKALGDSSLAINAAHELAAKSIPLAQQEEAKLSAERDKSIATIQQLEAQELSLNDAYKERQKITQEDRSLSDTRAFQDTIIRRRRAQEDLDQSLEDGEKQHQDELLKITDSGAKRIEDLQQSITDKYAESSKQILDATKQYNKSVLEAQKDYQEDAINDAIQFERERDAIKENFRRQRDKAELETDVRSFIDAQQDKRDSLKGLKQDEKDASDEREKQLQKAIEAANEAQSERLEDIKEELTAFTEKTAKEIEQTEKQTAIDIAESDKAFQEKLLKDAELREIQKQRETEDYQLRFDRMEQDRAIADKRAADTLAKQLADITTKETAEQEALDAFILKIEDIKTLIGQIQAGGTTPFTNTPTGSNVPVLPPTPEQSGGWWNQLPNPGGSQSGSAMPNITVITTDVASKKDISDGLLDGLTRYQKARTQASLKHHRGGA